MAVGLGCTTVARAEPCRGNVTYGQCLRRVFDTTATTNFPTLSLTDCTP